MITVSGISLPFTEGEGQALERAARLLRLPAAQAGRCFVVRRALDCRRREAPRFVYTVGVELPGDEAALAARLHAPQIAVKRRAAIELPRGEERLAARPVVAGFGPAGMFCALLLAHCGYRPLVLERGADVDARVQAVEGFWRGGPLLPEQNVQFGEGGAGTFSDGKLTTRIGDARCDWVMRRLVGFGAPPEILGQAKPHIGTDLLRGVVRALREEVIARGGEVRFHTPMTGLVLRGGAVAGVRTPQGELPAGALVAALGHSARDTFRMLLELGVEMEAKPFSVGVRIEHRREDVERALFGSHAGDRRLPAAEYQLSLRRGSRGVYTFCMCPGGVVVPAASSAGELVVNGMSEHRRDGENSNSALVCGVEPGDFGTRPLDGVVFQKSLERAAFRLGGGDFRAPAQTAGRFLAGRPGADFGRVAPSYCRGVREADLGALLPCFAVEMLRMGLRAFGRRQPGFDAPDAVLTGVETRTSSPVRFWRGEGYESNVGGLYPCGEGAGYAGGILSAAVDGVRVAQALMRRFRPLDPPAEAPVWDEEFATAGKA